MQLKQKFNNENYYYLGKDKEDGTYYFLGKPPTSSDWHLCSGWLEGLGTDNPEERKTQNIVFHKPYMALDGTNWTDETMNKIESPIPKTYLWKIMEIHKELVIISQFMELCQDGDIGITHMPATEKIVQDANAYTECNKKILAINKVLDDMYEEIQKVLDKKED